MWVCNKCKEEIEDQFDACWNCGYDKSGKINIVKKALEKPKSQEEKNNNELLNKYKSLSTYYTFLAIVFGFLGICFVVMVYQAEALRGYGAPSGGELFFICLCGLVFCLISIKLLNLSSKKDEKKNIMIKDIEQEEIKNKFNSKKDDLLEKF